MRMGGTCLLWKMMECLPSYFPKESKCFSSHPLFSWQWPFKNVASVTGGQTPCVTLLGSNGCRRWPAVPMLWAEVLRDMFHLRPHGDWVPALSTICWRNGCRKVREKTYPNRVLPCWLGQRLSLCLTLGPEPLRLLSLGVGQRMKVVWTETVSWRSTECAPEPVPHSLPVFTFCEMEAMTPRKLSRTKACNDDVHQERGGI